MGRAVFQLDHVSRFFRTKDSEVRAVDDVSLTIEEGEIFGIIGMSGAGKSTLVRTLNRLEEIDSGTVFYYGQDLSRLNNRELNRVRQSMPMIFQGFNLLMQRTVLENVMIPLKIAGQSKSRQRKKALETLKTVGLEDKAKAYPAQLSGGQRQRVAIARALTVEPKVLLCDEATSALDPKITEEILELLQNINREIGLTIVIITHEMSVVEKICSRVAIIDHGQVAECGEVKEVFTRPQSEVARHLIFPSDKESVSLFFSRTSEKHRVLRIVFDGRASSEPLIANLARETGQVVNILGANTRSVGGIGFGQMIIELPEEEEAQKIILAYFDEHGVTTGEVN